MLMTATAVMMMAGPPTAAEQFEMLKAMEGTWVADVDGDGVDDGKTIFKVTSAGSIVHATMAAGTPNEMVNVYHLDGDDVLMTHYCAAGNQPQMKMARDSEEGTIRFDFLRVTNLSSPDAHYMGGVTYTFIDENTVREDWVSYANQQKGEPFGWEMKRKVEMSTPESPEGMPAFVEYTIVLLRPVENRPDLPEAEAEAIQAQHLAHLGAMRDKGMVFAGPFGDRTGGMCIYQGPSLDEVRALAEADPAVKAGRLTVHAHPWLVPGGLTDSKADK